MTAQEYFDELLTMFIQHIETMDESKEAEIQKRILIFINTVQIPREWNKEEIEKEIEEELKESAHFYGGWSELKKVITNLEDNENESAFERFYGDQENHVSKGEEAERMHRIQRDLK